MKIKTIKDLAKAVTLAEGKKLSITIAQVSEVLAILSDFAVDGFGRCHPENILGVIYKNGRDRQKKKRK